MMVAFDPDRERLGPYADGGVRTYINMSKKGGHMKPTSSCR